MVASLLDFLGWKAPALIKTALYLGLLMSRCSSAWAHARGSAGIMFGMRLVWMVPPIIAIRIMVTE